LKVLKIVIFIDRNFRVGSCIIVCILYVKPVSGFFSVAPLTKELGMTLIVAAISVCGLRFISSKKTLGKKIKKYSVIKYFIILICEKVDFHIVAIFIFGSTTDYISF
jgi:hypothetical protein